MADNLEKEMSLLGHIGELRKHLVRIAISVVLGAILVGIFVNYVFDNILLAPTKNDFWSIQKFNSLFDKLGLSNVKFQYSENFSVLTTKLPEVFNLSIQVAIYGGIIISFPYIIYELWKFIAPGLKPKEKKNSLFYFFFITFLFFTGLLFGYFLIAPIAIQFFINYTPSEIIEKKIEITSIVKMVLSATIGMGLVFLQPVVAYALTSLGVITPSFLKKYRKHSLVIILVLAAIITPSDIMSMFVAAIPLWCLYEFSILLSTIVYKRNLKNEKEGLKKA